MLVAYIDYLAMHEKMYEKKGINNNLCLINLLRLKKYLVPMTLGYQNILPYIKSWFAQDQIKSQFRLSLLYYKYFLQNRTTKV